MADARKPGGGFAAFPGSPVEAGLSSAPRWVPTEEQVLDLFEVVPEEYHAALWLGGGQACRIGEVLAMEDSSHCFGFERSELHVVQQLQYDNQAHGGFFLKEPKGGSAGTVEFDDMVAQTVRDHLTKFGTTDVELVDATTGNVRRRTAKLLFVDAKSRPFHDRRWSELCHPVHPAPHPVHGVRAPTEHPRLRR